MMESLSNLIGGLLDASPPVLMAIGLWLLGEMIKRIPSIQNWVIPFVTGLAGAVAFPLIAEIGKVSYHVRAPWLLNAIIGFCIGGGAVQIDQMRKQIAMFRAAKAKDPETEFIRRPADVPKPVDPVVFPPAPPTPP